MQRYVLLKLQKVQEHCKPPMKHSWPLRLKSWLPLERYMSTRAVRTALRVLAGTTSILAPIMLQSMGPTPSSTS